MVANGFLQTRADSAAAAMLQAFSTNGSAHFRGTDIAVSRHYPEPRPEPRRLREGAREGWHRSSGAPDEAN